MEELSDKDFDQIFKNRIKDGYLEFEEESWLKMEKKLRSRNRYVFLRNASIILLFLSFGTGIYLLSNQTLEATQVEVTKTSTKDKTVADAKNDPFTENNVKSIENHSKIGSAKQKSKNLQHFSSKNTLLVAQYKNSSAPPISIADQNIAIDSSVAVAQDQTVTLKSSAQNSKTDRIVNLEKNEPISPLKSKRAIALSINIGPDFNSTENAVGGKRGIALGIGVSVPLTQKLSAQTGLNYGSKNYEAQGYDYTFNNPNTVNIISGIDASCKVLEIPLRASYLVMDNEKNSIDLNAGLSSYFMLKENYRFIYTAASARKDRFLEEKNANQHYLSVIDLSASYNIKLKNKKFALGIQPYVKIPLGGIGEGNVPLKSSGIALKLNYELIKRK